MKIDFIIKENGIETKMDNHPFEILSAIAPTNLWILSDKGIVEVNATKRHVFNYKKVVSLMEVKTNINGTEYHGKVITVAYGDYGLMNLIVELGTECHQNDNSFNRGTTYFVDLDELKQSKQFEGKNAEECFTELLRNSPMDYILRDERYVDLSTNEILDASEI